MACPGPVLPWPARYRTSSKKRPSMHTAVELDEHAAWLTEVGDGSEAAGAAGSSIGTPAATAANAGLAAGSPGELSARAASALGAASPKVQAKAEVSCTG